MENIAKLRYIILAVLCAVTLAACSWDAKALSDREPNGTPTTTYGVDPNKREIIENGRIEDGKVIISMSNRWVQDEQKRSPP